MSIDLSLFRRKSIAQLTATPGRGTLELKRTLGAPSLVALGIGAIIGAGLFILTGMVAADHAGPAVVLSFIVAAIGCGFAGMCYAELASMFPMAGSAYTYTYATMGELMGWIIGWDLVLEYAVGAGMVSLGWSAYVTHLLAQWGIVIPHALAATPFEGGLVNLPAVLILVAISLLLIRGISESARVNAVIVAIKVAVVLTVIGLGVWYIRFENYHPFLPANTGTFGSFGWSGVMRGAGMIFFAYIGFDAVSTAAQEAKNPQRDMPWGILGSLAVCTVLYIAFALVLTGIVNYHDFKGAAAPVAVAIDHTPYPWLGTVVNLGIICGFTTVILVMLLGQSRVFYAMSKDGLLPPLFSTLHPTYRTPWINNVVFMLLTALLGGFLPIQSLGNMCSIGTLLAFVLVCAGVVVLRRREPNAPRGYRTPLVPLIPVLGIVVCLAMMASLDKMTWVRLVVWLVIGLGVFFSYSRRHSRLLSVPGFAD
jgi:APA family basic amino acid/polyamine antiporter